MFGLSDLADSIIYKQCQLNLTVVGDPHTITHGLPTGLLGIHQIIADALTALQSLTLKGIPKDDLSNALVGFFVKRPQDAVLPQISIVDTELTKWPEHLFFTYGQMLENVELRNCQADPLRWYCMMKDIWNSPTIERLGIIDCKVVDQFAPENARKRTLKELAPFKELGATHWVGNTEIRKDLKRMAYQIRKKWGPGSAAAVAQ